MFHQNQTNLLVSIESMSEADRREADAHAARTFQALSKELHRWRSAIASLGTARDTSRSLLSVTR